MATTPTTGVGMFGPTVTDLRQQYLKNLQGQFSAAQSPYERMGLALGNILGTAFGVKDPALEQASTVQSIYSAVAMNHPDQTTPEFYKELANTFSAAGLNEQALMSAEKAKDVEYKNMDRQIKLAQFTQTQEKSRKENVDYYKKNPEQAEFRIAQLAETLSADPTNATALQEYNQITRAASEGSIEAAQKAQKEELGTDIDKVRLAKYRKDLEDAQKFGPGQKEDVKIQAARDFLTVYNIDPDKPIKGQIPAGLLYGPGGRDFLEAQQTAKKKKTTEGSGPRSAAPAAAPRSNDPLGIR